jgi:hypothetical protein
MTAEAVERLMGGPCASVEHRRMWLVARVWKAYDLEIEVLFDNNDNPVVLDAMYHHPSLGDPWEYLDEVHERDESLLGIVRERMKRGWSGR